MESNSTLPDSGNHPTNSLIYASIKTGRENIVAESEDILITKCIERDSSAQNRLYNMYASKMFAVCYRYSRNREEAEDILHEGFMKVFDNISKFRKEGSLEGWIRKIMYNTAIQKFRQRKLDDQTVSMEPMHENSLNNSSNDTLSQIGVKELISMIQNLPPRYQLVFNLYVFEGLKHREIAEQLGITEGTSKSNLSDARTILQREINKTQAQSEMTAAANGRK
jgi:RNA polymerase sigma factor (sigma-70 family)